MLPNQIAHLIEGGEDPKTICARITFCVVPECKGCVHLGIYKLLETTCLDCIAVLAERVGLTRYTPIGVIHDKTEEMKH